MCLPRIQIAVLASAASLLFLTGCADQSIEDSAESASPLAPYYQALHGSGRTPDDMEREVREASQRIEEDIAECMKKQGFQYTPFVPPAVTFDVAVDEEEGASADDEGWVERWGYGIVAGVGEVQLDGAVSDEPVEDPNSTYYESLTVAEQLAYNETLYGPEQPAEGDGLSEGESGEPGGCVGAAAHREEVARRGPELAAFDDLIARMDSVWADFESHPGLVALNQAWSACMEERGEPGFDAQQDAADSISTAYASLRFASDSGSDEAQSAAPSDLSTETSAEVAALQKREIELALVDLACREETDYDATQAAIFVQIEQEFVDANKEELEAMKRAAEQVG